MDTFSFPEIDDDILIDMVEEVNSLCMDSTNTITMLLHDPDNKTLINKLFRSVHTIKGNIGIAQISPLLPLLMATEDILDQLREDQLQFDNLISDVLITVIDQVRTFISNCADFGFTEFESSKYLKATKLLSQVQATTIEKNQQLLSESLQVLDATLDAGYESNIFEREINELGIEWEEEIEPDLIFFHDMMIPIEKRLDFWEGRSRRQLKLAMLLNQFSGNLVDEQQLRAAIYLHDIGMAILPLALLRRPTTFSEAELTLLRGHVQRGVNFLSEMPHWSEARRIILEHHEHVDGQGYPGGLKSNEISDGAKILAIVDAFEAMTHERVKDSHRKRPITHAVSEINYASGTHFCPYWVSVFNNVISSLTEK